MEEEFENLYWKYLHEGHSHMYAMARANEQYRMNKMKSLSDQEKPTK